MSRWTWSSSPAPCSRAACAHAKCVCTFAPQWMHEYCTGRTSSMCTIYLIFGRRIRRGRAMDWLRKREFFHRKTHLRADFWEMRGEAAAAVRAAARLFVCCAGEVCMHCTFVKCAASPARFVPPLLLVIMRWLQIGLPVVCVLIAKGHSLLFISEKMPQSTTLIGCSLRWLAAAWGQRLLYEDVAQMYRTWCYSDRIRYLCWHKKLKVCCCSSEPGRHRCPESSHRNARVAAARATSAGALCASIYGRINIDYRGRWKVQAHCGN